VGEGVSAPSPIPRSVVIRSYALEELIRISRFSDGDLSAVTQHLATGGWRFAGGDESWDRFLKARLDAFGPDAWPASGPSGPLDRTVWELGAFKHAKVMAKRQAGSKELRWNATQTSQHMATFAGLLAEGLGGGNPPHDASRRGDPGEADLLVFLALGFPETYGSPVGFLRRRGGRRTQDYVERHWSRGRFTSTSVWQTSSQG